MGKKCLQIGIIFSVCLFCLFDCKLKNNYFFIEYYKSNDKIDFPVIRYNNENYIINENKLQKLNKSLVALEKPKLIKTVGINTRNIRDYCYDNNNYLYILTIDNEIIQYSITNNRYSIIESYPFNLEKIKYNDNYLLIYSKETISIMNLDKKSIVVGYQKNKDVTLKNHTVYYVFEGKIVIRNLITDDKALINLN